MERKYWELPILLLPLMISEPKERTELRNGAVSGLVCKNEFYKKKCMIQLDALISKHNYYFFFFLITEMFLIRLVVETVKIRESTFENNEISSFLSFF